MQIHSTDFEGLFIIEPDVYEDNRGYFFESFKKESYDILGHNISFVQDNESSSEFGVIRGLHYQLPPYAQAKLVRAVVGRILDVVVDLRPKSKTYGKHFSLELSDKNKTQLFIPAGFAHGYAVFSDKAIFSYKCTQYYQPSHEAGVNFADKKLNIDWVLDTTKCIVSKKDKNLPSFGAHEPYE